MSGPRRTDQVDPASSMVVTMPPDAVRQVIVDLLDDEGNVSVTHVAGGHVGFRTDGSWRTYAEVDALIAAEHDGTHVRITSRPVLPSRWARRRAAANVARLSQAIEAADRRRGPEAR